MSAKAGAAQQRGRSPGGPDTRWRRMEAARQGKTEQAALAMPPGKMRGAGARSAGPVPGGVRLLDAGRRDLRSHWQALTIQERQRPTLGLKHCPEACGWVRTDRAAPP